jgi:tRNA (mo5U34)-methyltransferase
MFRRRSKSIAAELQAEIDSGLAFMYPWDLGESPTPLIGHDLPSIHGTRARLIEPVVRQALRGGGRALDLACHEGYFAHRLREWGASEVLGIDIREVNVRRAKLLADHYALTGVTFEQHDVYALDPHELGRFEVVLVLGLIYHLENPIGALRIAKALSSNLCVVESQVTQQTEPIRTGWGIAEQFETVPASWAALYEDPNEQENQPLAAFGGVISLVPNRAALDQALRVVGLRNLRVLEPGPEDDQQYRLGDRVVAVGYV